MASKTSFWVILDALFPVCMVCFGQEVRPPWALAQADAGKVMEWGVMYLNVRASRGNIAFASKRIVVYRLASSQWLVEAMHQFRIS